MLLSAGLLAGLLVLYGVLGSLQWRASAQMTPRSETEEAEAPADMHGDANADESKAQDDELTLQELVKRRSAVQGVTARGQTIADAPPFEATKRIEEIYYYPCSDCHDLEVSNPRVRVLEDEHTDLVFEHGGGRFWCYDACHNRTDMDHLVSLHGEPISYDETYKLCGQCHFQRQKDWYFGGHGKRAGLWRYPYEIPKTYDEMDVSEREEIGSWRGPRLLHNCPDCHNPHSPSIKPFEPSPPPARHHALPVYALEPEGDGHQPEKIWDRLAEKLGGTK